MNEIEMGAKCMRPLIQSQGMGPVQAQAANQTWTFCVPGGMVQWTPASSFPLALPRTYPGLPGTQHTCYVWQSPQTLLEELPSPTTERPRGSVRILPLEKCCGGKAQLSFNSQTYIFFLLIRLSVGSRLRGRNQVLPFPLSHSPSEISFIGWLQWWAAIWTSD